MATIKSSQVNITDLDFDAIGKNLKEYLKGQETLKDYNFEGSNINLIIDLLAYSSHVSAFNANMVASELFLDTAQIRKNVVSRAKEIGCTPTSATASMAKIDLQVNNPLVGGNTPTSLTLNRGHKFKTNYDGANYNYVLLETKTNNPLNGIFKFEDLELYQGTMNSDIFAYNGQIQNQRFPLTEELVDTTTITVTVESTGGSTSAWTQAKDISDITGAGDTAVATLAIGIASKLSLAESATLANMAAGIVVSKVGTSTVSWTELSELLASQDA